ncbi:hypothetical protein QTG56_23770 (plasmid) [Rossellomorea sp. AcN35-11]|nr:hypothetical protein QTG56_23770 [Rossellomorea sp. AcN35-11]
MDRKNIFTRTERDVIPQGLTYYDSHAQMSFLDIGEPIICYKEDVLKNLPKERITNMKLLNALNQYDRIKYCHSLGEVMDLRTHELGFHAIVTEQCTHVLTGVSTITIQLIPDFKFTSEQIKYLFKNYSEKFNDVRSVLLDLKHPYRSELVIRMNEVLKSWTLIQTYEALIPKDYYIEQKGNRFEVFDLYDMRTSQRSGCSKTFKTLKMAIQFLWTVENNGYGWEKIRDVKDIPKEVKIKIKEVAT